MSLDRPVPLAVLAAGLALAAGCSPAPAPAPAPDAPTGPITVLAASSLTETLGQLGHDWTAKGHPPVTFSFDASSRLAGQIEAGAPADAFFSADVDWMDELDNKGLVDTSTRADVVGNALVVVVPATSALQVGAAADLAAPAVAHLALAGESVPAGKYGRAALVSLGAWDGVKDRVVTGDNVRTVLGWVAAGEADAGVVYATDAKVEPKVRVALTFPASSHPPIVYPAAVVKGAAHAKDAADFLAYCESAEGMAVFTAAGFTPAPDAK